MDQDGLGAVKQANIGTSAMDQGMESNDGQVMDQEWSQVFEMMEQAEVSDFVVNFSLKSNHALRGFGRLKPPPNHTYQSETVRKYGCASSERPERLSSPPNLINQSETVRKYESSHFGWTCRFNGHTKLYKPI